MASMTAALIAFASLASAAEPPLTFRATHVRDGFRHELVATFLESEIQVRANSNLFSPSARPVRLGEWRLPSTERLRFFREYFAAKAAREKRRLNPFAPGRGPAPSPHETDVSIDGARVRARDLPQIESFFAAIAESGGARMAEGAEVRAVGPSLEVATYEKSKRVKTAADKIASHCVERGGLLTCRLAEGQAFLKR